MIQIDLFPSEQRRVRKQQVSLPPLPVKLLLIVVTSLFVVIQAALGAGVWWRATQRSAFQARWDALQPRQEEAGRLKQEIAALEERLSAMEQATRGRLLWGQKLNQLARRVTPGIWLTELVVEEERVPIVVETTPRKKGAKSSKPQDAKAGKGAKASKAERARPEFTVRRTLSVRGTAFSGGQEEMAYVGRFMESVKGDPGFFGDFEGVELVSVQRDRIKETEVVNFTLRLPFARDPR